MTKASWSQKATVLLALVIASVLQHARAGIVEGSYRGSETWMYLDRFVFNPAKSGGELMGRLQMTLDYPSDTATTPSIMLFYKGGEEDGVQKEFGYWERAYNKGLKCHEKAAIASMNGGTYIPLPGGRNVTTYTDDDGREWSSVTLETYMNTHRSRWIFITVGNCKMTCTTRFCANSLDIKYRLVLTNGDGNDKYFSADKAWFWETSIIFFVLYIALAILAWRTRLALLSEHKYHHSVRLLVASIAASFLSLLFQVVLYSQFASTGIDNPRLEGLAVFCGLVAEFLLLLMTILVAKGWTIVRHKISALGRVRIAAYMTLYVVSSAGCWIYYAYFVDPADIIYVYSTVPGAVFVSLRGAAFAWFTYAIGVTLRKYQQKRAFYKKFWVLVGCWILTLPALVLINSLVDIWFRAKVVNLLSILSTFLCQAVLCSMYHPTLCGLNRNFPFHATTFAVLKNKTSKPGQSDDTKIHGSNTFDEAHLLRAFELSSQMRHSVSMLQTYTSDLHTFLDDIRLTNKESSSNGKHDIESGIAVHPQVPTQQKDNLSKPIGNDFEKSASTEGDLERALAAVVAPKSAQKANLEQNPVARSKPATTKKASFRELQSGLDLEEAGDGTTVSSASSATYSARETNSAGARASDRPSIKKKNPQSGSSTSGSRRSRREKESVMAPANEEKNEARADSSREPGPQRQNSKEASSNASGSGDEQIAPARESLRRSKSGKKKRRSSTAAANEDASVLGGMQEDEGAADTRRQRRRSSSSRSNGAGPQIVDDGDL